MNYLRNIIIDAPLVPISYVSLGIISILVSLILQYNGYLWTLTYGVLMILAGLIFFHTSIRGKCIIWEGIIEKMEISKASQVLDLGTGHGLVLLKFAALLSEKGHATGIDLWRNRDQSNNTLEHTQAIIQHKGLTNIASLITADVLDLPFENNKYDVVTSSMVLHNIKFKDKRQKALDEAGRVLKDSGALIIVDTGNHKKEYIAYLLSKGYIIDDHKTYGIIGWWTGPWMATYSIVAKKNIQTH